MKIVLLCSFKSHYLPWDCLMSVKRTRLGNAVPEQRNMYAAQSSDSVALGFMPRNYSFYAILIVWIKKLFDMRIT